MLWERGKGILSSSVSSSVNWRKWCSSSSTLCLQGSNEIYYGSERFVYNVQYMKTIPYPSWSLPTQPLFSFHMESPPTLPRLKLCFPHTIITSTHPCVLRTLCTWTSWVPGGCLAPSLFGQRCLNPRLKALVACHQSVLVSITCCRFI